jgi:hypothetical protein
MTEHNWQFRITDGEAHTSDNGLSFFVIQATEMALMANSQYVSSRDVKLEQWHNDVLMVTGIAVLAPN